MMRRGERRGREERGEGERRGREGRGDGEGRGEGKGGGKRGGEKGGAIFAKVRSSCRRKWQGRDYQMVSSC